MYINPLVITTLLYACFSVAAASYSTGALPLFQQERHQRRQLQQCPLQQASAGDTPECASLQTQDFELCFAVRGNGPRLFAHFPVLARAVEDFGIPSGYLGSSSATITGFLFESLLENPFLQDCGGGQCCTDMEQRARISFVLKTFQDIAQDSFLNGIFILPETILQRAKDRNILLRLVSPIGTNRQAALDDLIEILIEPFGVLKSTLVNPELIKLLNGTSPNPIVHAIDTLRATAEGFRVGNDPLVLLREYILNFRGVAWALDFVASFWAGLEPTNLDEMQTLFQECGSVENIGLEYSEISMQPTSNGETCGEFYMRMYGDYLSERRAFEALLGEDTGFPSRLDLMVGDQSSLTTLISTAVANGDAATSIREGIAAYKNLTFDIDLDVNWADGILFGYFGPSQALDTISSQLPNLFSDAKSQRFFPMGPTTWREALVTSPAEPTLSNAVPAGTELLSLGGWSDPIPTQVLKGLGCERVVLINRPGGIGDFTIDIAALLGASDQQIEALYSVELEENSVDVGLQQADATFCTDWDSPPIDFELLAEAGYDAPLLSHDGCVLSLGLNASAQEIAGCTPIDAKVSKGNKLSSSSSAVGSVSACWLYVSSIVGVWVSLF